jgi:hypothetical protein
MTEPAGSFQILRARDRATLAVNPFRSDTLAAPASPGAAPPASPGDGKGLLARSARG